MTFPTPIRSAIIGSIRPLLEQLIRNRPRLAPSLYDVVPRADILPRSMPRTEVVPAEEIVGTVRHPSNTTAELLPLPHLRGSHWRDDWRRVLESQESLSILPPVDLVKIGSRYFVIDGHKRVAAARRIGGVVDAIVVELHGTSPERYEQSAPAVC
jgi:hypothetical protein